MMPARDQHTAQAGHNEKMLKSMAAQNNQIEFSDWYVTVSFYAALHYFEAILPAVKPQIHDGNTYFAVEHSQDHNIRNKIIKAKFARVHLPYSTLYRRSRRARYNCHIPNAHNWIEAEALLGDVKKECDKLIPK